MNAAIVGAGAAGCFCAIELKRRVPDCNVEVFESQLHPLAKVALTGGGRCNLTNTFREIRNLNEAYPRGERVISRAFRLFDNEDCCRWFEREGVRLVAQEDNCIFPVSQDAMQIVKTLQNLMNRLGVTIHCNQRIKDIKELMDRFDAVVITTGGGATSMLEGLELKMIPPVPALFTFNIEDRSLRSMMGTVVEDAAVSLCGTKFKAHGPLLITDWGVSGPAILKLSSYGARYLHDNGYRASMSVSWAEGFEQGDAQKQISSSHPEGLSSRLWRHIISRSGIREDMKWGEAGSKSLNKLRETLTNDIYAISGKGSFKDEFVTCGGVSLSNIDLNTLESRKYPGLYFAGEVLDIDAITGGFNLQAAWSTGYAVAVAIAEKNL